jgi:hypothetical protein
MMSEMMVGISMILVAIGSFAAGFLFGHTQGMQMYRRFAIRICNIFNNETAKTIGDTFRKTDF